MSTGIERREKVRCGLIAPIKFSEYNSDNYDGNARMINHSAGGVSFISDHPLILGSDIFIRMEKSLYNTLPGGNCITCRARVRWCRKALYDPLLYNIGVQFSEPLIQQISKLGIGNGNLQGLWENQPSDFS